MFVAVLACSLCLNISPSIFLALFYFNPPIPASSLSSFIVHLATKNYVFLLISLFFFISLSSSPLSPSVFLSLSLFYPGIQTSLNSSGASSGALVTAVDLIKTLQNSSENIKVRKYNKSPQRY